MTPRAVRRAGGVALLEVVVALVVLAGFGAALFSWSAQTSRAAAQAVEAQRQLELRHNIDELAASLNPSLRPTGRLATATHVFEWTSTVSQGPADQLRRFGGTSPYEVALYVVEIRASSDRPGEPVVSERRTVAGFKQVRPLTGGLFGAPLQGP